MPTYEYKCTRCGELTTEFKPMSAPRRQRCPLCRSKVELQISGGLGVLFKGDGFYINDSRKANRSRPKEGSAEAGSAPKDSGAGGDAGTSAPAAPATPAAPAKDKGAGSAGAGSAGADKGKGGNRG
ncbi:MAG: zinc ribbon domain-containing protein [bacterium]|nr:zinc ribbon domain-containing protein [bacterium]